MKNNKQELFETTPIPRAVATLAIPTIIASLVTQIYNMSDTYFVGLLNDAAATSAVSLASPIVLATNAITNLFGIGTSSKMSRALGVKDYKTVKKASSFGVYGALICAFLYSMLITLNKDFFLKLAGTDALTYQKTADYLYWTVTVGVFPAVLNVTLANMFRAEGSTTHASIGVMSGCILNIILDPIFIQPWGFNMGVAGAGCATCISNIVASIYFIILYIVKHKTTFVTINPKLFIPTKEIFKDVFAVGIPAAIQCYINVTGITVLNRVCAKYGATNIAAMGIAHKIQMVSILFAAGAGQGVMPLIGYNFSSGNSARVKEAIRFTERVIVILLTTMSIICFVFSKQLVGLFIEDKDVIFYGSSYLKAFSLSSPFMAIDHLGISTFQACGKGKISLFNAVARRLVFDIPAVIVLDKLFPVYGMCYGQLFGEFFMCLLALYFINKFIFKNEPKKA